MSKKEIIQKVIEYLRQGQRREVVYPDPIVLTSDANYPGSELQGYYTTNQFAPTSSTAISDPITLHFSCVPAKLYLSRTSAKELYLPRTLTRTPFSYLSSS